MPNCSKEKNIFNKALPTKIVTVEDTSAPKYVYRPPPMTGVNAAPITAVSVVNNIKHVWCVAIVVMASDGSLRSFGGTFSKSNCCKSAIK